MDVPATTIGSLALAASLVGFFFNRQYIDNRFKQERFPKLRLDGPMLSNVDESGPEGLRRRHRLEIGCRLLNAVEAQNIRADVTLKLDRQRVHRATLVSDRFLPPSDPIGSFGAATACLEDLLRDWGELREEKPSSGLDPFNAWVFRRRPRPLHATLTWSWEAPLAGVKPEHLEKCVILRPKTSEATNGGRVTLLVEWELLSASLWARVSRPLLGLPTWLRQRLAWRR
jgi:hypothetical protein